MKMAEFLNLDTKQVQWLDASLEHPNLVRVPDGASGFYRWKDKEDNTFFLKKAKDVLLYSNHESKWEWCHYGFEMFGCEVVLWQRNPLQEKINETLSALSVNKAQLSGLLGREKSYVKRLLAKNRNVTEKTKATVIDQLDQLISQHEQDQGPEDSKCVKKLTVTLSVDTKEVQDELKKAYSLIDQANDNSIAWQKKYKDQKNFIWVLLFGGILSWTIFLVFIYDLA